MNDEVKRARAIPTGLRIPVDLMERLDEVRRSEGLSRTEMMVAALRRYLNKPAPAEMVGRRK